MIALVTGASGFIGSHLVDALRAAGHAVRVVTRPLPPHDVLCRAAMWDGITHVFHLAARTRAPHARAFHEANVEFTERLLRAAEAQPVPPRFVFVSSLAASGPAPSPDRPRAPHDPATPIERYGISKLAAEASVRAAVSPYTIVRLPAVFGPRDRDFLMIFRQAGRPLHWRATPDSHALTITHVHDVVQALLVAAQHEATHNGLFHVGGHDCTWDALYRQVHMARRPGQRPSIGVPVPSLLLGAAAQAGELWARLTGHTPLATPDKIALGRAPYWLADGARFAEATSWQPQVTLEDGVRDTLRWYQRERWL